MATAERAEGAATHAGQPNPFAVGTTKAAAYEVLARATEAELMEGLLLDEFVVRIKRMRKDDSTLWPANTKTPANTLSAALSSDYCFRKTASRTFTLSGNAAGKIEGYGVATRLPAPEREAVVVDPNAPRTATGRVLGTKKRTYAEMMEEELEHRRREKEARDAANKKRAQEARERNLAALKEAQKEAAARRAAGAATSSSAAASRQAALKKGKGKAPRPAPSKPPLKSAPRLKPEPGVAIPASGSPAFVAAPLVPRPKRPSVFDRFPFKSRQEVLSGMDSPLQAVELGDVVNADVLSELDADSRAALAKLVSEADRGPGGGVDPDLFASPSFKATLELYQELLCMGLLDTSSGQPRRIVEMYYELRTKTNALEQDWCARLYAHRRTSGRHSAIAPELLQAWAAVADDFNAAMQRGGGGGGAAAAAASAASGRAASSAQEQAPPGAPAAERAGE